MKNRRMNIFFLFSLFVFFLLFEGRGLYAEVIAPNLPDSGILSKKTDSFYDIETDYARFSGRVTDKDATGNILKIYSETKNVKFFKVGDEVHFAVNDSDRKGCKGAIRDVDGHNYFVIYVKNWFPCWNSKNYFKRGTMLNFYSKKLANRILEGSRFRQILLEQKRDYLLQLKNVNNFIWRFNQFKLKLSMEYDEKIVAMKNKKQKALDEFLGKKKAQIVLQTELRRKLTELDERVDFFRVEREDLLLDRWSTDHDNGLPIARKPQRVKVQAKNDF